MRCHKHCLSWKLIQETHIAGKVKVLWDDGLQETVRFGEDDIYDVHVVSEPKYLDRDEAIAIGIFVFRGMYEYQILQYPYKWISKEDILHRELLSDCLAD